MNPHGSATRSALTRRTVPTPALCSRAIGERRVTYETGVKTGVRLSQPDSTLDFRQLPLSTEAKLRQRSIVPVFQLRPHLAAATLGGPVTTNSTTRILRTCSKSLAMRALFCSLSAIHHRCDTEPMGPTFYGFWGHFSGSCTVRRCTHGDLAFQTTSCKAAMSRRSSYGAQVTVEACLFTYFTDQARALGLWQECHMP